MKIDWFTVIAQVINFLMLVWLLKRFLYKPVLDAIDEREKNIVSRLKDAEAKKAEAAKEQDEFSRKNDQFEQQKKDLMDKAIAASRGINDQLMENARTDADALQARQRKVLAGMQKDLEKELSQKIQQQVFDISRKVLGDLAAVGLEEQSAKLFISRLQHLNEEAKQRFIDAFTSGLTSVLIQSAFELPLKQQTGIKQAVDGILGMETVCRFETKLGLISGIEMTANGYRLAWSISAYLDALQDGISATIKEKSEPPAANEAPGSRLVEEKKQVPEQVV